MKAVAEVVIGVDAHKRTHTLVAADELGRQLAAKTVPATAEGHRAALAWADRWPARRWALEDCRHLTRTLEGALLRAGEQVVRVPTQMMAGVRRSARQRGKSDAIDALAVARAACREPDLPIARLDGPSRQVRLLIDHRDDLVASELACRAGSAGICTRSRPTSTSPPAASSSNTSSRASTPVWTPSMGSSRRSPASCSSASASSTAASTSSNARSSPSSPHSPRRSSPSPAAAHSPPPRSSAKRPALDASAQKRLRPLERHRPIAGQLRQHHPRAPQARRQPPGQRRPSSHRRHPSAHLHIGPRLPRPTHPQRQRQDRSAAPAAPPSLRRRLPRPAHRRAGRPPRRCHQQLHRLDIGSEGRPRVKASRRALGATS
jgi:Transposase